MQPKSFSASALNVASLCLSRYHAEQIERARGENNTAASLGTAVHAALEGYVNQVKFHNLPHDWIALLKLFEGTYRDTFSTSDLDTPEYDDGQAMLIEWFNRTDLPEINVISTEKKDNFIVPTSIGDIPFNYIWDRFDQLSETEFRVVDYKTNRWGARPEDLKKKIQARSYGLAAQIPHPEATRIWVEFDFLRHQPVGIVFTREENAATWRFIKAEAERIIAASDENPPETLNPECRFCVRKQSCTAFTKNCNVGGVAAIVDIGEAIERRALLEFQQSGIKSAIEELDRLIFAEAEEKDVLEFETDLVRCGFTAKSTRSVDAERVEKIVGPELFSKYGGLNITMAQYDKLVKDSSVDKEQRGMLQQLIYKKVGEPRVKIEPKNLIDDE